MLKDGDLAPDFTGINQNGERLQLSQLKGKKTILYFYPKDNTPGCTVEACNLNEHYGELIRLGFEVIGVSPDTAGSHQKFIEKYSLQFHLIADTEKEIMTQYEAYGEKIMYGKPVVGVLRKTYLIDETGKILKIIKKVDTKNHVAQILKAL